MIRLAIFDLDGTLLNTIGDLADATNYALRCCGYPERALGEYNMFVGNGIAKLFERALPETARTPENIERMRSFFIPYYTEHNTSHTLPYRGVPELLAALQRERVELAVASNKYQQATENLVAHFFPEIKFASVFGQREGVPVKPDPAIVRDILAITSVAPEEVLYIGDSGVDMRTAAAAGIVSVGVTWGFRTREELESNGACHIADTTDDVFAICRKLSAASE